MKLPENLIWKYSWERNRNLNKLTYYRFIDPLKTGMLMTNLRQSFVHDTHTIINQETCLEYFQNYLKILKILHGQIQIVCHKHWCVVVPRNTRNLEEMFLHFGRSFDEWNSVFYLSFMMNRNIKLLTLLTCCSSQHGLHTRVWLLNLIKLILSLYM